MFLIRVAAGDLNQTPLDWANNKANIVAAIEEARAAGASVLCLPELCISGYGCEDAFLSSGLARESLELLQEILPETRGMVVSVGLPLRVQKVVYNTACLIADGQILGFVAKRFLAGDGLHYEPRWFKPWPEDVQHQVTIDEVDYPVGDLCFNVGGVNFGFEICEDAWVAQRAGADLASRGVDIILNPSASHFAFGKSQIRRRFVLEGSRAFAVTYVYANLQGNEAGRAVYDGGGMIAAAGEMLASGRRFSYQPVQVTTAVTDLDAIRDEQAKVGSYRPDLSEHASCVVAPFDWPNTELAARQQAESEVWERSDHHKEEEFTRAECLALFDYMRKSRSRGFVVSLSGGADSAACATLIADMVSFACAELGVEEFRRRLSYLDLPASNEPRDFVAPLLACVYQATRNSSDTTRNAARDVATAIGATYLEFDVDALVHQYTDMVAAGIGRELTWEQDDLALQNIQARVRAPSVWMLANIRGALLVATSNRSEAAVGYATMDGDTCGGISPIAGIDKAFLRQWLAWRETAGPAGLAPLNALAAVTAQAPTAELRPLEAVQTDEADLMPYELLDAIETEAIGARRTPSEVLQVVRVQFDYPLRQLGAWIERFFRLWCRNQWKRERYAPSFHVDDKNLDPKTWCRFPILSGGFTRELREMHELIEQLESA